MNHLEEQRDMKLTLDHLVDSIKAGDERSVESFLGTYQLYRSVLAQDGRFDLLQEGELGPDRIRGACSRALHTGIKNGRLMPEGILRACMRATTFLPGVLRLVFEHYPALQGEILEHFRNRPLEVLQLLKPHYADNGTWLFNHLKEKDPQLLTHLIQFNLPFIRELDYKGFDQIVPVLYALDDEPTVSHFLKHWEAGILEAWKIHADTDGKVLDTRTINVISRLGTPTLQRKMWYSLHHTGTYQDYAPIRDIKLTLNEKDITQWFQTGYQHATFIFCLALENKLFDLKDLAAGLAKGYSKKYDWGVKGLNHAVEIVKYKGGSVSDARLMEVLGATTESLRDHPMAEEGLYVLAEHFGKQAVMKTGFGKERSDLFLGQDLGL